MRKVRNGSAGAGRNERIGAALGLEIRLTLVAVDLSGVLFGADFLAADFLAGVFLAVAAGIIIGLPILVISMRSLSYNLKPGASCLWYTNCNMASSRNKQRTYARNRIFSRAGHEKIYESDGRYLLKLVLIILLGTVWLKFAHPLQIGGLVVAGLPVGMLFGLVLVSRMERYQFDRKIWYAILIIVTILSYFLPAGIVI